MKRATGKSNLNIVRDYVAGNRPFIQVGYDPNLNNSTRKEGEEWEDGQGNKWIWKNGSKIKVPKIAKIIIEKVDYCWRTPGARSNADAFAASSFRSAHVLCLCSTTN